MTFWYKRGHTWQGVVLLPKTFKRLDHSTHTQVVMSQVHPCNWSLLPSTVSSVFTCVLFHHACSDTHAQVFQESLGVPLTPQLVPPLPDCCAFQLVSLCTASTVEAMCGCYQCQTSAVHITILASLGGCQLKPCSLKHEWRLTSVVTQVCKCSCRKVSSE